MAVHKLYVHNKVSAGARDLANALGIKRLKQRGSEFQGGPATTVINWGATSIPERITANGCRVLNKTANVAQAVDKHTTLRIMTASGVRVPEFTERLDVAQRWIAGGGTVFARTLLRASSGRGIVIMEPDHPEDHDTQAPLYVRYVPKRHEYRIHVVNGQVIDRQRKGLAEEFRGQADVNFRVRNLANGFIFVRNDGHVYPPEADVMAVEAVRALGLDFGAADIIWNEQQNRCYLLEVNSAPGLQGTTVDNYAEAFRVHF